MELAGIGLPEDFDDEDKQVAITGLQNRAEKVRHACADSQHHSAQGATRWLSRDILAVMVRMLSSVT